MTKGGFMANKRKPTALHALEGTLRKDRHAERNDIELPPGIPEKPDFLGAVAGKEWDFMVEKLSTYNLISDIDGAVLAAYCELYAEFSTTRTAPHTFPASKFAQLRMFCNELGLSASARTKIPGSNKDPKPANPFSKKPKGTKAG